MTREEHRLLKLKKVAHHLNAAANELLAHNECEALRKELKALEQRVQQRIDRENPSLLTNIYDKEVEQHPTRAIQNH